MGPYSIPKQSQTNIQDWPMTYDMQLQTLSDDADIKSYYWYIYLISEMQHLRMIGSFQNTLATGALYYKRAEYGAQILLYQNTLTVEH